MSFMCVCSFCGKHKDDFTGFLIVGPEVSICEECVGACNDVLRWERWEKSLEWMYDLP